VHLNGGKFLVWGYGTNSGGEETKTWIWNAFTGDFTGPHMISGANIFCCGLSQLPDGRAIVAGGNDAQTAVGIKDAFIFNPTTNTWTLPGVVGMLNETRWYPTLAALADGTITAISGWGEPGGEFFPPPTWRSRVDIFNATLNIWGDFAPTFNPPGVTFQPHFYPFMIPYHDPQDNVPKLFFAGKSTANDIGIGHTTNSYSLRFTNTTYNNGAAEWRPLGGVSDIQGSGAVIMIGRTNPIDVGTVYKFGGKFGGIALDLGRKIDLNSLAPDWTETHIMNTPRAECNIVAMANGRIAAVGGTSDPDPHSSFSTAIRTIEIYNPAMDTWSETSPDASATRMYHSTASMTPNATILTAGGEFLPDTGGSQTVQEINAQEYYPSYFLSPTPRPVIVSKLNYAAWNSILTVRATGTIDYFSLLKLSSTTHANDMTQRFIKLTESQPPSGEYYYLKMPANGGIAPPGYYMLSAVAGDFPSVARYIRIGQ